MTPYAYMLVVLFLGTSAGLVIFFLELALIGLLSALMTVVVVHGITPLIMLVVRTAVPLVIRVWHWFSAQILDPFQRLITDPLVQEIKDWVTVAKWFKEEFQPEWLWLNCKAWAILGMAYLFILMPVGQAGLWPYYHLLVPIGRQTAKAWEWLWNWTYLGLYELWIDFNLDVLDHLRANLRETWQWFVPKFWAKLGWTYLFVLMPLGETGLWTYRQILTPAGHGLTWIGKKLAWMGTKLGQGLYWLLAELIGKPFKTHYLQPCHNWLDLVYYSCKLWAPWILLWTVLHEEFQVYPAALLCICTGAIIHFVFDLILWNPEMHKPREVVIH